MTPEPRHSLTPLEIDWVEDQLYVFNVAATGHADGQGLGFALRDDLGRFAGVAAGYSWGGIAELKQMWVREDLRGQGHGEALVRAFLEEARARDCSHVWVLTFDFQAPGFYRRFGFQQQAELGPWPQGHTQFVLRLIL